MIRFAEIFQNGMTLQREKEICLWGTSDKDENVRISIQKKNVLETKIKAGAFKIYLPAQEAAYNCEIRITTENQIITFYNVDIGEIWIAGGQSNMEFLMLYDKEGRHLNDTFTDEHLRFFDVGEYSFEGEREEGLKDATHWDRWMCCDRKNNKWFSAVGFYYAKKLRMELDIPVAVVGCNWGGTSASTWMDADILCKDELLKIYIDDYNAACAKRSEKKYLKRDALVRKVQFGRPMEMTEDPNLMNENTKPTTIRQKMLLKFLWKIILTGSHDPNRPGGLYEMMIREIAGFSCRGVIWYQGESDEHHADIYARLFGKMIECWRNEWKEELPFVFVQLAPWEEWLAMSGQNYPVVREQQQLVEDTIPNTYMASIMDCGSQYDIHPKNKKPVGERLAILALKYIYGYKMLYADAPRMNTILRRKNIIDVSFLYCEDGLTGDLNLTDMFDIMQDGKRVPYVARIENNHVILSCNGLMEGTAQISFGYRPYLCMTLKNKGGLAARPFAPVTI